MKKIDARSIIIGVAVTAAVAAALYFVFTIDSAEDEDRSVIIVRNGSVDLELTKNDWDLTDKKNARPDHPKGGHVIGFMVTFDPTDAAVANSGCPTLPVVGSSVDIEYKLKDGTNEHVAINAVLKAKKNEPVIGTTKDMTLKGNKVLSYGIAGEGSIVSVTVTYGKSQKCAPSTGFLHPIEIKPLR